MCQEPKYTPPVAIGRKKKRSVEWQCTHEIKMCVPPTKKVGKRPCFLSQFLEPIFRLTLCMVRFRKQ